MEKENVLSKVEKLLNLANHPNTTEAEASAAALMAQKLILQYSIKENEIDENRGKDPFVIKSLTFNRVPIVYKFVFKVIEEATLVKSFTKRTYCTKTDIMFFGRKSNAEIAIHMFIFLQQIYQNLWESYKEKYASMARYKQAYFKGLSLGTLSKLRDQEKLISQKSSDDCTAIVRCKKEVEIEAQRKFNFRIAKATASYYADDEAQTNGFEEGRNINLRSALKTKKAEYQLA